MGKPTNNACVSPQIMGEGTGLPETADSGFTLIEMLVVLAVLGILFSIGAMNLRPDSTRLYAGSIQALMHEARAEAIKRTVPVMVSWDAASVRSVALTTSISSLPNCAADEGSSILTVYAAEYGRVQATSSDSIYWLPSGTARMCKGNSLIHEDQLIEISLRDGKRSRLLQLDGTKVEDMK